MNEYDSLRIAAVFDKMGFAEAEEMEEGDYLIVNTCSVREKPQHKAESAIGRFRQIKRRRPEVKIGFCGCVAQQEGENLLKTNKDIDFVVGTDALHRLEEVVAHVEAGERLSDIQVNEGGLEIDIFNREVSVSSFVTIMKGCNNFCSYCIVPYVRGREKSREQSEIIDEIKYLADKGAREITLLGQNVNSYGTALTDPVSFPELLDKVSDVEGIKRIRFVTSHPKDFSNELIDVMRGNDKICEYLHLPLQSGSNAVLQKMNRKYTYDHYKERVLRAKEMIPDLALSSDFIVGFPGETEDDFQSTMKALEEIRYDMIYAFNYSTRPGTKAESFNDDVPLEVKKMRLAKLLDAQKRIIAENSAAYQDLVVEVMVEGESKKGAGQYSGRNRQNRVVNFSSETILSSGDFVNVKITEPRPNSLLGERV